MSNRTTGPEPTPALVWDSLLGGHQGSAADKAVAAGLTEMFPRLRELVRVQRAFAVESARWAAAVLGIDQFIEARAGLPAVPAVHESARIAEPEATCVYVDPDPECVAHLRAAYADSKGIAVVRADPADPEAALSDPALREVIDLRRPVAVILGGWPSSVAPDIAATAVSGFARRMAPGSAVSVACLSYADPEQAERMAGAYGCGPFFGYDAAMIEGLFAAGNLRIVHGRAMDVRCWPACPVQASVTDVQVIGGIGIKD